MGQRGCVYVKIFSFCKEKSVIKQECLTIVVSVMDPKLLMKMLQVTLTGGPDRSRQTLWTCLNLMFTKSTKQSAETPRQQVSHRASSLFAL